jgi:hypothetical protein
MDFDPGISIGGVVLLPLVFGLVEFLKSTFNIQNKAVTVLSFFLGAVFMAVVQIANMYPEAGQWVVFGVLALTMGLSASGYYKFIDKRTNADPPDDEPDDAPDMWG